MIKRKKIITAVLTFSMLFSIGLFARNNIKGNSRNNFYYFIASIPAGELSIKEKNGLLQMREEEKLARDVYKSLYEKYRLQVFSNIANSEQRHMDAIAILLGKYSLNDPVVDDAIGKFSNPNFKKLYKQLTSQGDLSLINALKVGTTIEDLDIADLKIHVTDTDNRDIKLVYENLMRGSRNHMRAFSRLLNKMGGKYTPKHISTTEYRKIILSDWETSGKKRGNMKGGCKFFTNNNQYQSN
jgi:hypothetical protein